MVACLGHLYDVSLLLWLHCLEECIVCGVILMVSSFFCVGSTLGGGWLMHTPLMGYLFILRRIRANMFINRFEISRKRCH